MKIVLIEADMKLWHLLKQVMSVHQIKNIFFWHFSPFHIVSISLKIWNLLCSLMTSAKDKFFTTLSINIGEENLQKTNHSVFQM